MKLKRSHKKLLAGILLLLYAFVATPVSYWHSHSSNQVDAATGKHVQLVKKASAEANCKICSHHYPVVANDAIVGLLPNVRFFTLYSSCNFIHNIATPDYCQSNKGPPVNS